MQKKRKNKKNVGFKKYITYCINLFSNIVNKKKINNNNLRPPSTVSYLVAHYEVPEPTKVGYQSRYSLKMDWYHSLSKE